MVLMDHIRAHLAMRALDQLLDLLEVRIDDLGPDLPLERVASGIC
ncbi:MAG: hypothetical protein ACRDZY_00040 [Acidimicrobiales bacterium]